MPDAPISQPGDASGARGDVTVHEPSRVQQATARRAAESRAIVPDLVMGAEVDMERCLQLLAGAEATPRDALVKACALALREHPLANARYRDGRFELLGRVNVGIAIAAHDTVFVPTIFDADARSLRDVAGEARALAGRVASREITQPELGGATFTVIALDGPDAVEPVIHPPQAAAIAAGRVADRALVRDGQVVAAPAMTLTLACDHRILYGSEAAGFLARVRALLEDPGSLSG